ncbi:ABC transporter ATP-binding protein [Janibacter cremeus]|uniref:ABC transporter ATP-binding protein n=1 Tax=Janibacter cremeus TaxID=1285192 RepID=UPI0023F69AB3|nr:ABC transporter ATP-binding protein [Janibacter cremeus]WEV76947.1 ABC transporter ATP-binding protein [Janibacter cremeus]
MGETASRAGWQRIWPVHSVVRLRRAWRRLSPFFRSSTPLLASIVVVSILAGFVEAGLLMLIASMAVGLAEGGGGITQQFGPLSVDMGRSTVFAVAVGMALLRAGLQLVLAYIPARMSAQVLADLRIQLFESFTSTAWSVKSRERDGAFQNLMMQNASYTGLTAINLGLGITATIMFVTMTVGAFLQNFVAAAVFMAASLALFVALRPLSRRLRKHAKRLSREVMSFTNTVQEVVQVAEETEVFGSTPRFRDAFRDQVEAVRRPYIRTRFMAVGLPGLYQSVALLLLVVALIAVGLVGTAELAALAAVILLLIRALTYAQQIQSAITTIDERVPFMNQIADALERYRRRPQQDGPEGLEEIHSLGLAHVCFGYERDTDVLHDVSFELRRGEAIGIVGPSGAGKSSIVQVLLRLRDPRAGAVVVNGRDVRAVRRADWQRRVAYVPQSSQVIWGTVRENIVFHRDWITDEEVVVAARRAHIHDDIMSWPLGYDTVIGQRASAVSGGQRQRICLARALAEDPEVLVLDEPTSALDVRSEELVQQSLREIKRDTITILVAHRLSTLTVCDRIVVMVDGRVSALGTQADLMEESAFFREVNEITQRQTES